MAHYRVKADTVSYFPKGVEPSQDNLGKVKTARKGDVIDDFPDDPTPDGLLDEKSGVLEQTTAQAKTADDEKK